MRLAMALIAGCAMLWTVAVSAQDCSPAAPCTIAGGEYLVAPPAGPAKGAVLFLHGYGGSGAAEMRNMGLMRRFTERGYAVIAPTALSERPGSPTKWNVEIDPARRDDIGFLGAVTTDAAERFGVPRDVVVAAGFSEGGMMVWRLACDAPDRYAAFAPASGVMWRPLPEACAAPVRLLHTHGWADTVVPLEGRSVAGGTLTQGDVFESLALARRAAACPGDAPDAYEVRGELQIRRWTDCDPAADLVFALHPGGHGLPEGWAEMTIDWVERPGGALAIEDGEG